MISLIISFTKKETLKLQFSLFIEFSIFSMFGFLSYVNCVFDVRNFVASSKITFFFYPMCNNLLNNFYITTLYLITTLYDFFTSLTSFCFNPLSTSAHQIFFVRTRRNREKGFFFFLPVWLMAAAYVQLIWFSHPATVAMTFSIHRESQPLPLFSFTFDTFVEILLSFSCATQDFIFPSSRSQKCSPR